MNCYEFEINLSNFIEGELRQKDIIKFKSHKKECVGCCEKLQSMILLISGLGKMNSINISDNFSRKLYNKISIIDDKKQVKSWEWIDIFDFGFKPKQAIAFGFSIILVASSIFYFSEIETIPNINMADFNKPETTNSGSIPDITQPKLNYATTQDTVINFVKNKNGKKIQSTPPIQIVNSKK